MLKKKTENFLVINFPNLESCPVWLHDDALKWLCYFSTEIKINISIDFQTKYPKFLTWLDWLQFLSCLNKEGHLDFLDC